MLQRYYITSRGGGGGAEERAHGGQEHIQVRVKVWNMLSKGGSVCVICGPRGIGSHHTAKITFLNFPTLTRIFYIFKSKISLERGKTNCSGRINPC